MERVQDAEFDIEVYANDIEMYLSQFCEEQGIEDLRNVSQNIWNAALMYIRKHVFPDKKDLKISKRLTGYDNSQRGLVESNCNAYDTDIVNTICDYYTYMAYKYDKEISIAGFSKLTGINMDTIIDWGNKINKLSTAGCEIYTKLTREREESLTGKLISLKHPTSFAIMLNKHYGYNLPGVSKERKESSNASPEQIGARYGAELTDNSTDGSLPAPPE